MSGLTVDRARAVVAYDAETGVFRWRVTLSNRALAGSVAGSVGKNGYNYITIDGARYLAHRLAVLLIIGKWPEGQVDHRDTDSRNNRWTNLREVTHRMNCENKRRPLPNNSTGFLGVSPGRKGRFKAQIQVAGRNRYIGEFDQKEQAHSAYVQAKRALHEGCTL